MGYQQKHIDQPMSLLDLKLRQGGRYAHYYFGLDRASSTIFPDFYNASSRDFLRLMSESKLVIIDSGGIQEETTILGIPCLTIRENTERPITITEGTNILVGTDTNRILSGYRESLSKAVSFTRPKFWDGKASERIVQILLNSL
ncbi:MAG: UDP-N-acetylglucosamine 2-epimerase [Desulfobacteraceae bacterium]|nr:UDP-N-acetylglucosamine 2-epimerase [Desulfobacteraceae bacterium]